MGEWVSRIVEYSLVLAGGMLTGVFYFGGLWLTVRRLISVQRPALLMLASFTVRTAIALALFYAIMNGSWLRLVAALAGFLVMRQVLTWSLGPGSKTLQPESGGATHHEHHA